MAPQKCYIYNTCRPSAFSSGNASNDCIVDRRCSFHSHIAAVLECSLLNNKWMCFSFLPRRTPRAHTEISANDTISIHVSRVRFTVCTVHQDSNIPCYVWKHISKQENWKVVVDVCCFFVLRYWICYWICFVFVHIEPTVRSITEPVIKPS